MGKAVLVILDACGFEAASEYAGYLEHLIETGQGAKYRLRGELPSISRAMYATLLTGLPASAHGINANAVCRRLQAPSVFSLCRAAGLCTAAAAYGWMSELFNTGVRFELDRHRFQLDSPGDIRHGIFYSDDSYPDTHLLADAEFLRTRFRPDFLVSHSMNIDWQGHRHGAGSREYHWAVYLAAEAVGQLLPRWLEDGYSVVVTADHGMDERGIHGGPAERQRTVPLYLFGPGHSPGDHTESPVSQLVVAPLLCRLLGLPPAPGMVDEAALLPV